MLAAGVDSDVVIHLWRAPPRCALALYVFAKWAELYDHAVLDAPGVVSGHTIKHLLATAATAVLVGRLVEREKAGVRSDIRTFRISSR